MKKILIPFILLAIALPVSAQVNTGLLDIALEVDPLEKTLSNIQWALGLLGLLAIAEFVTGVIGNTIARHTYKKISPRKPAEIVPIVQKSKGERISQAIRLIGLFAIYGTAIAVVNKLDDCLPNPSATVYNTSFYIAVALFIGGVISTIVFSRKEVSKSNNIQNASEDFRSVEDNKRYYKLYILSQQYKRVIFSSVFLFVVTLLVWAIITFPGGEGCGFNVTA